MELGRLNILRAMFALYLVDTNMPTPNGTNCTWNRETKKSVEIEIEI